MAYLVALGTIAFAISLLVAAFVGLSVWSQATYFTDPGPYASDWVGYDRRTFVGLIFFTFCATPGIILLVSGTRSFCNQLRHALPSALAQVPFFLLGLLLLSGGIALPSIWSGVSLKCMLVFCVNQNTYPHENVPNAGYGWQSIVGIAALLSLAPMGIIISIVALLNAVRGDRSGMGRDGATGSGDRSVVSGGMQHVETTDVVKPKGPGVNGSTGRVSIQKEDEQHPTNYSLPRVAPAAPDPASESLVSRLPGANMFASTCARISFIVVAILLLLILLFITFYVPNSWEYFVAHRIAANAALVVTADYNTCQTFWQTTTCSEYPWATMTTANWNISTNLVAKVYPSNLIFYLFLVAVLVVVGAIIVADSMRVGKVWLNRRFAFLGGPGSYFRTTWTIKEALITFMTIGASYLFFYYWIHDHNFNGSWTGGNNRETDAGIVASERWGRSCGQLAVFFLGLLFFPASRWSVVHHVFGTSWEGLLWAHRVLGYAMLGTTIAHTICWWKKMDEDGVFPKDIIAVPMQLAESIDNFTVPLVSVGTFLLVLCMGVFALYPIRRRFFELFYYSHLFAAYSIIPIVLWHAAAGWEYLLPGLSVWFIDRMIRLARSSTQVRILALSPFSRGVTRLVFQQAGLNVGAGQYVFINLPCVGLFEWHPFTVVSGDAESGYTLLIRDMGEGTWTHRLFELASDPVKGMSHGPRQGSEGAESLLHHGDRSHVLADIEMYADGPYGHVIHFEKYSRVRLLTCGIGITPGAAIFASISESHPDVRLVWSLREKDLAAAMRPYISSLVSPSDVHITSCRDAAELASLSAAVVHGERLTYRSGRPNIREAVGDTSEGLTLVFVCGPEEAVERWEEELFDAPNVVFHRETFLL